MRLTPVLVISLSTMVSAACASGAGQPKPSTSGAPSSAQGPVAACVVGEWTTAQLTTAASASAGTAGLSGGGGVIVRIDPAGRTEIDFTAMDPAKFSASAGDASVAGTFRYMGRATGQVRTGDATSTSGPWEPVGTADFSDVKITVDLTEPVTIRPFDNVPISAQIAGNTQTGGVIEADPLLSKGQYRCGSNTLSLSKTDGTGLTWQLSRKPGAQS